LTIPVVPTRTRRQRRSRGGVRAIGLPPNLSVYGVGDTLDEALDDLGQGVRALLHGQTAASGERAPGRVAQR